MHPSSPDAHGLDAEILALRRRLAELESQRSSHRSSGIPGDAALPRAERVMRDSESRRAASETMLLEAQRIARIGSWEIDFKSGEVCWSHQTYVNYGVDPETFVPSLSTFQSCIHPDDSERIGDIVRDAMTLGSSVEVEFRIVIPDGSIRVILALGEVTRFDPDGSPRVMTGIQQDITERRRTEREARESRLLLQNFLDSLGAAAFAMDLNDRCIFANRTLERTFGIAPGGIVGRTREEAFPGIMPPAVIAEHREHDRIVVECGQTIEFRERNMEADGEHIYRTVKFPIHGADGALIGVGGIATDVTETVRAEAALAASEARFREIFAESPIAIATADTDGHLIEFNGALLVLFGVEDRADVRGLRLFDALEVSDEAKRRLLRGETARHELDLDFDAIKRAGLERTRRTGVAHVHATIAPLGLPTALRGFLVHIQDTSEQRRAEARLRAIYENSSSGIALGDLEGRIVAANPSYCRILGYDEAELLGRSFREFTWGADLPAESELLAQLLAGELTQYAVEKRYVGKGGRTIWVNLTASLLRNARGEPEFGLAMVVDITERKRAEEERSRLVETIHQYKKMESIGTLAGGVAHDFNNILAGLMAGLALLELELGEGSPLLAEIEPMKALAERGAQLTRQLLGFARRGKYDARPLALERVVRETSAMFGRTRRDVVVTLEFESDLPAVLMDHSQMEQVLLNLLMNAGQAMPMGGRIALHAERTTLTADEAGLLGVESGPFARVVVADNGIGMDAETRERIFEPFFTTKPVGQGSGLGLASVWGIVKNHGGVIQVESSPGLGTTFTLLLPSTDSQVAAERTTSRPDISGKGTVLVVDDEEVLRRACARLLSKMGYTILTASGGREAVELVREHREHLAFVILDLTMPEMSGAATFEAIREVAPETKVLLSSGFSAEGEASQLLARGCKGFIQKPYSLSDLTQKIKSIL